MKHDMPLISDVHLTYTHRLERITQRERERETSSQLTYHLPAFSAFKTNILYFVRLIHSFHPSFSAHKHITNVNDFGEDEKPITINRMNHGYFVQRTFNSIRVSIYHSNWLRRHRHNQHQQLHHFISSFLLLLPILIL